MPNELDNYRGRTVPGPATLAACLIDLMETLYPRVIALAPEELKQGFIEEFAQMRDQWRPALEDIIRRPRR